MRFLIFLAMAVASFVPVQMNAQARTQGSTQKPDAKSPTGDTTITTNDETADGQIVKVTMATSRPDVTASGNFGVYADLQNMKSVPVTLYPREVTLVVQPEVTRDQECVVELDAFFPTEERPKSSEPLSGPILIPPKEHYQVFWGLGGSENSCEHSNDEGRWSGLRGIGRAASQFIGFTPGEYSFQVVGKAYLSPNNKPEPTYHTFIQGTKLHVGITQWQAVFASMLGGLLAYFVMGLREGGELRTLKREEDKKLRSAVSKWLVILRSLCSAALLSAVITVILSRISDTQFPVKVTVSDFWGALTVGFLAYFMGNKIIDRIVGTSAAQPPAGGRPITPPGNSSPGATGATGPSAPQGSIGVTGAADGGLTGATGVAPAGGGAEKV